MIYRYRRISAAEYGFMLVELLVVAIIFGILAALAIPRFIHIDQEAREAALKGFGNNVRNTVALVHSMALAEGLTAASGQSVKLEEASIKLAFGYPTADIEGVVAALQYHEGFNKTFDAGPPATVVWVPLDSPATPATCQVIYRQAVSAIAPASVTVPLPNMLDCR